MLRKSMERHTVWRDAVLGVRDSNVRERPIPAQRTAGPGFDLIASKLRPSPVRSGTIRRSSLIERLTRDDSRPIVSVVAPPGYGKTTLLSHWAERSGQTFAWVSVDEQDKTARFQETLRRLAMVDEAFVADQAGLGLEPAGRLALDAKTVSLLQLAVSVATGSPGVCLEWSTARAMAAGATDDEIADVLLAIAPVVGLGRVVCAAADVATALGYDVVAALEEPDDH